MYCNALLCYGISMLSLVTTIDPADVEVSQVVLGTVFPGHSLQHVSEPVTRDNSQVVLGTVFPGHSLQHVSEPVTRDNSPVVLGTVFPGHSLQNVSEPVPRHKAGRQHTLHNYYNNLTIFQKNIFQS